MRGIRKDLTGLKFNKWVVINYSHTLNKKAFWNCICECGTKKSVAAGNLLSGISNGCRNPIHMKGNNLGEKHGLWKENVSYKSLHQWVRRNSIIPNECEDCGLKANLDAANVSHEYKRDLSDWKWLCRKCHWKFDDKSESMKKEMLRRKSLGIGPDRDLKTGRFVSI